MPAASARTGTMVVTRTPRVGLYGVGAWDYASYAKAPGDASRAGALFVGPSVAP